MTSAYWASVTFLRSSGRNFNCMPGLPPLTYKQSKIQAVRSISVVYFFFIPIAVHPPRIYPVILFNSFTGSISIDFSLTLRAAFFRSNSAATGITNTSVSYTHLDVYKRQVLYSLIFLFHFVSCLILCIADSDQCTLLQDPAPYSGCLSSLQLSHVSS